MKKNNSAGILLFKYTDQQLHFLLLHPGGPFWKNKDTGAWTIPKGEFGPDEDPLSAAKREFTEETGQQVNGTLLPLTTIRQKAGKLVYAWALQGEMDIAQFISNTFEMEWPPRSGKIQLFPEADKAGWFELQEARQKINPAQVSFLEELQQLLNTY